MACCDETPPGRTMDMRDLPIETFCCMARMAYVLCLAAQEVLTTARGTPWGNLTEAEQRSYGEMAKTVVCNGELPEGTFNTLFSRIVSTMATAS